MCIRTSFTPAMFPTHVIPSVSSSFPSIPGSLPAFSNGAPPHTFCRPAGRHTQAMIEITGVLNNQLKIIGELLKHMNGPILPPFVPPPSPPFVPPSSPPFVPPSPLGPRHHRIGFEKISEAIGIQLSKKTVHKERTISIGLWNPGPLNQAKAVTAATLLKQQNLDAMILCEANSKRLLCGLCPLNGIKLHNQQSPEAGGTGALCRTNIAHSWTDLQSEAGSGWSIGELKMGKSIRILGLYISPRDNRSLEIFEEALQFLAESSRNATLILGDFNAPFGSKRKKALDEWTKAHGFNILQTAPTHKRPGTTASHLDLILVPTQRATAAASAVHEQAGFHHRVVTVSLTSEMLVKPINRTKWNRLRNPENQVRLITKLNCTVTPNDPFNHLSKTGELCLGMGPPPELAMLPTIQARCQKLSASEVMESERENIRDLKQWSKERTAALGTPATFWKLITQRKRTPQDPKQVQEYFGDLYGAKAYPEKDLNKDQLLALKGNMSSVTALDDLFSETEVLAALLKTGKGKAPGLDGIPYLALKVASKSDSFIKATTELYNSYLQQLKSLPQALGILHAIPKKDKGYRPITIQNKIWQILEVVCWTRIKNQAGHLLEFDNQYGFVPKKDCSNHLLETRAFLSSGSRKRVCCFLDITKAFDTVPREYVCCRMADKVGSSFGRFFSMIVNMTLQPRVVTVAPTNSHVQIIMERGVPQGGVLSPWLFNCVMDPLQRNVTNIPRNLNASCWSPIALYADDIKVCGDDLETVQLLVNVTATDLSRWGGKLSLPKCEAISSGKLQGTLTLNSQAIPFKEKCLSLGRLLDHKGASMAQQCSKLPQLIGLITRRVNEGLPCRLAIEGYRAIAWGKLLYGCEVFPPPTRQVVSMHSASLRPLLGLIARRTHRCVVQREVGAGFHPIIWVHKRMIRWLKRLNPQEKQALLCMTSWWREAFPYLAESRQPNEILADPKDRSLIIAARIKSELLREADNQGILNLLDPVWQMSLNSKAYLSLSWAQYGTLFRLPSFYSADAGPVLCPFCMQGRDSGFHITVECLALPKNLREERESLIDSCGGWQNLRLADDKWVTNNPLSTNLIIEWMRKAYQARARTGKSFHNRKLFCEVALHPPEPHPLVQQVAPARRTRKQQTPNHIPGTQCEGCQKIFARSAHLKAHHRLHQSCPSAIRSRQDSCQNPCVPSPQHAPSLFTLLDSFTNRA